MQSSLAKGKIAPAVLFSYEAK